jgi:hypothetical protein
MFAGALVCAPVSNYSSMPQADINFRYIWHVFHVSIVPAAIGMSCATMIFAKLSAILRYDKQFETDFQVRMGINLAISSKVLLFRFIFNFADFHDPD